jgi:hypothetical protein
MTPLVNRPIGGHRHREWAIGAAERQGSPGFGSWGSRPAALRLHRNRELRATEGVEKAEEAEKESRRVVAVRFCTGAGEEGERGIMELRTAGGGGDSMGERRVGVRECRGPRVRLVEWRNSSLLRLDRADRPSYR